MNWQEIKNLLPKINWETTDESTNATNTDVVYPYSIIWNGLEKEYHCYYADGKFKPFKTVADAQEWVEQVHYPEKVNEILRKLGVVR